MTISLKVPATMNVRAEVSAMTVNSVHTMKNAMVPPKSISIVVLARDWIESKYGEPGSTIHKRSITSDRIATVTDITAAHKGFGESPCTLHGYQKQRVSSIIIIQKFQCKKVSYQASMPAEPPQGLPKPLHKPIYTLRYLFNFLLSCVYRLLVVVDMHDHGI